MTFLVKGVGDVSCPASKKVPIAIAIANTINKMPVRRLEKSIFFIIFIMSKWKCKFNTIFT